MVILIQNFTKQNGNGDGLKRAQKKDKKNKNTKLCSQRVCIYAFLTLRVG